MDSIPVSEFKATCLAVPERVNRTGRPVEITCCRRPVAELIPPQPSSVSKAHWLGAMTGRVKITGDIVAPLVEEIALACRNA